MPKLYKQTPAFIISALAAISFIAASMTNQEKMSALTPSNPIACELSVKPKDQQPIEEDVIEVDKAS
jgi:hypothetical protein